MLEEIYEEIDECGDSTDFSENEAEEESGAPLAEEAEEADTEPDYEALINEDLQVLRSAFGELAGIKDITELENPVRYGALRDLGLTPEEAYLATTKRRKAEKADTKLHLRSSLPKRVYSKDSEISYRDMEIARDIFPGVSDKEIRRLYKKVTR